MIESNVVWDQIARLHNLHKIINRIIIWKQLTFAALGKCLDQNIIINMYLSCLTYIINMMEVINMEM